MRSPPSTLPGGVVGARAEPFQVGKARAAPGSPSGCQLIEFRRDVVGARDEAGPSPVPSPGVPGEGGAFSGRLTRRVDQKLGSFTPAEARRRIVVAATLTVARA